MTVAALQEAKLDDELTSDDLLRIIESNRNRIRNLSSSTLSAISFLLTATFASVLFILNNPTTHVPIVLAPLLLCKAVLLIISASFSVAAILMPSPFATTDKTVLVDQLATIYRREYRCAQWSVRLLLSGILLFSVNLVVLSFHLSSR